MQVQFISSYLRGSVGIGGSPADSVFLKLGASPNEPVVMEDGEGQLTLSLDKGTQSQGGRDAAVVGTVALPPRTRAQHGYLRRNNSSARQLVTTDSTGSMWLLFGTDSGFEGLTELWYTRLWVGFTRQ